MVSHDLTKFSRLLLRRHGYVLEQLTSPLVVRTSPVHAQMLPGVFSKHDYHRYRGFYRSEGREFDRSEPRSLKKLLYCFRVLMTGIVLLLEAKVEANALALNERFRRPFIEELERLKAGAELGTLRDDPTYTAELDRLEAELDRPFEETTLPEAPPARDELERLIVTVRRAGAGAVVC